MTCPAKAASLMIPLLMTACAAPPFLALSADGITRQPGVEVADTELCDVLRVSTPVVGRDAAGRLDVAMLVTSLDEEPLDVVATVRFVDGNGRTIPGGTILRHLRVAPEEAAHCAASAPGGEAVAFAVRFEWDR